MIANFIGENKCPYGLQKNKPYNIKFKDGINQHYIIVNISDDKLNFDLPYESLEQLISDWDVRSFYNQDNKSGI